MKYRFGTTEWLVGVHACFEAVATVFRQQAIPLNDSLCEVYENVPTDVSPDGDYAWACTVVDGTVDFQRKEIAGTARRISIDFASAYQLTLIDTRGDADEIARLQSMLASLIEDGKASFEVNGDGARPFGYLVHDAIARITA